MERLARPPLHVRPSRARILGDPGDPLTPPTSSFLKFLVLNFITYCLPSEIRFICTTDNPCHLWCDYGKMQPEYKPWHHKKRGTVQVHDRFIMWGYDGVVEQVDPGDTNYHEFRFPDPHQPQPSYWMLHGTRTGRTLESQSQFFHLSCPAVPPLHTLKIYSDPWHGAKTVDGKATRNVYNQTWANIHDGAGTNAYPDAGTMGAGMSTGPLINRWTAIERAFMSFDLTPLPPGVSIQAIYYKFFAYDVHDEIHILPSWQMAFTEIAAYNNLVPADYNMPLWNPISDQIDYSAGLSGTWLKFTVNPLFFPFFTPGTIMVLGIREVKYDYLNIRPSWIANKGSTMNIYPVDSGHPDLKPYLQIDYYG